MKIYIVQVNFVLILLYSDILVKAPDVGHSLPEKKKLINIYLTQHN